MAGFIRRYSVLLTTLILLICSFQLMSASIQDRKLPRLGGRLMHLVIAPVQQLHYDILSSTGYIWRNYIWLVDIQREHALLSQRLKALEAQNSHLIEFESENARLRQLLNFHQETGLSGIAATVIGRDVSNWIRTITIDRGSADGIRQGYPVVDGHAIVGQTTVVSAKSTKVLLLTDSRSAIDAIVQSSRSPGIVEGTSSEILKLRYVLKEQQLAPGDRVIASGLDGVYPKGTLIGVVTEISSNSGSIFHDVNLHPSVDINRLENVLVIIPKQSVEPPDSQISERPIVGDNR